jgi:hypothetical protein
MRRRLRRQRQMREALLLDLGALVFELHRQGRREPELLQAKAAELTAVDEEVRALADALQTKETVMQLVATGVAGSCEACGALMSVDARFCSSCGAPAVPALGGENGAEAPAAIEEEPPEESPVSSGQFPGRPPQETAELESAEEGVLNVGPMEEPAAEEEPPAEEAEEPPTVEADAAPQQPPSQEPAQGDAAIDHASRAIRSGIERGRRWIRSRRTGE